ncbi:helix-turn-helix domain-containing protein [Micromonospora sagamiensis]|uniref:Helix-turn-helix protein n=1 Tax=Micromonospora sagamiensis TaxID=47875 RepID=A0A562W921_9ACTN|nr:helix-turn-helix transcriptional regulator [Micromonospora sagamiensis]TWJ26625.1 helix-turn-helix protein [Micromonospora sagamiensis]BCL14487.1 transcriptional regulator [Micromonospora sagamiensis]
MSVDELPIGRRVAQWRIRRRMTQQMLADRLGRSKSWVDKVERGVRALDRFSVIRDLAEVLRVDPVVLLGRTTPPSIAAGTDGVDAVRAALARYDFTPHDPDRRPAPPVAELSRRAAHAWLTYQHAHYSHLLRMLPGLLADAQHAHAAQPECATSLLVQVYRVTSSVLVKLGEADLAWLAADRAVTAAGGDRQFAAVAAIPLAQALRALGRDRLAMAAALAAAPPISCDQGTPDESSVLGTLLLQAALAAAGCGDTRTAHELTDRAAEIADLVGEGDDDQWTCFGPTAVELARVVAAVDLGDAADAITRHGIAVRRAGWRCLPAEHRAAYLIDVARAYLQVGDLAAAGRALVDADRTAPAETRSRPAARTVIAAVARGGPATAGVAHLASTLGVA